LIFSFKKKEKRFMTIATPPKGNKRDKALQRALKFAPLFQENTFENVLDSLSMVPESAAKTNFDAALDGAGIKAQEDKDWLYHYLQHMNEVKPNPKDPEHNKYWDEALDVAAYTGW
jgi:hypothetical protein